MQAKQRWTFHPAALKRIETYHAGQLVRIVDDMETVQRLQIGHGEWTEAMAATLREVMAGNKGEMEATLKGGNGGK